MTTSVPKAAPTALPELDTSFTSFTDLFRRRGSHESLERYVTGLLTDVSHKTCDTIAAAVAGTSTERLPHLLTDADWDATALDQRRVTQLLAISPAGGLLALNDKTFPKQGRASVGVGRQYCGALGKVANCQTFVTAEYSADDPTTQTPLPWPVTAQLFLPDAWIDDQERCQRAHVPEGVQAQTKHDLARAVIDQARAWQVPFRMVLADAGYGRVASFIKGLEERHLQYMCGVDKAFGVRKPDEVQATPTTVPESTGKGGRPRKAHPAPLYLAQAVLADLPTEEWQTVRWRNGSKGPMQKQFVALRMHMSTGESGRSLDDFRVYTSAEGWFIGERPVKGNAEEMKYYWSNLSADTTRVQRATYVRARWPIEQFYEDAKQECGLGDYQGRRWDGFHRHIGLVMLAYSFLVHQRMTETERAAGSFSPSVQRPTLPSGHRAVLLWLLQDLARWWLETDQITAFQSRRL